MAQGRESTNAAPFSNKLEAKVARRGGMQSSRRHACPCMYCRKNHHAYINLPGAFRPDSSDQLPPTYKELLRHLSISTENSLCNGACLGTQG